MASSHKLFIQLLLDFDQQRREMQEGLRQAQSTMSQSRQIGEDARRIHAEVLEAVFQAQHNIAVAKELLLNGR